MNYNLNVMWPLADFVVDPLEDGDTWIHGTGQVVGQLNPKCFIAYKIYHTRGEVFYQFMFQPTGADAENFFETYQRDHDGSVVAINGTPIGRSYVTKEPAYRRFYPDETDRSKLITVLGVHLPKNNRYLYDLVVSLGQGQLLAECPNPNGSVYVPADPDYELPGIPILKPSDPVISGVTDTALSATVNMLENADRYRWSIGSDPDHPDNPDALIVVSESNSVQVSALTPNTNYFVLVRGVRDMGSPGADPVQEYRGPWSNAGRVWTKPAKQVAPTLIERTDTILGFSTEPQSPNDPLSYVWKIATSESDLATATLERTTLNSVRFTDRQPATTYYVQVAVDGNGGQGAFSDVASFTTLALTDILPLAPSVVVLSSFKFSVSFEIIHNPNGGMRTSYEIQLSTSVEFSEGSIRTYTTPTDDFTIGKLTAGTEHYIRVKAQNTAGDSDWSTVEQFSTAPEAPGVPMGLLVRGQTSNSLRLEIQPGVGGDPDCYEYRISIYRSTLMEEDDIKVNDGNIIFAEGLSPLTTYYIWVRAINRSGISSYYSSTPFSTLASTENFGKPGRPVITAITETTAIATVNPPVNLPASVTYKWFLRRNEIDGAMTTKIVLSDIPTITFSDLKRNDKYQVSVQVGNGAVYGPRSSVQIFMTLRSGDIGWKPKWTDKPLAGRRRLSNMPDEWKGEWGVSNVELTPKRGPVSAGLWVEGNVHIIRRLFADRIIHEILDHSPANSLRETDRGNTRIYSLDLTPREFEEAGGFES